jgi:hypothetical protein
MRRTVRVGTAVVLMLALAVPTAALVSKRYRFQADTLLDLGVEAPAGLRLDSVRFKVPATTDDRITRAAGPFTARVRVSNTADRALRAGVAIALFDDEGRMLGVASGGSAMSRIKPGRQRSFTLVFDGVNAEAHKATAFQISLEAKR